MASSAGMYWSPRGNAHEFGAVSSPGKEPGGKRETSGHRGTPTSACLASLDPRIKRLILDVLFLATPEPGTVPVWEAVCCKDCAHSSTDRTLDYG